jgi:ABC-type lipoprotein export system ATPase subunit/GNAT superfamily N-acetyltransferase
MPVLSITRSTPIRRTPRVVQLEGLFDVPPMQRSEIKRQVDLPIEERTWQIGLIVGPSGCGKTTLALELFGENLVPGFDWPTDRAIVDGFPADMSIKEITLLLSSVGFSSPPSWLRPFGVLSNGEKFRATIARALAEQPDLVVIDEFTSVVDRTVAQIGSAAIAKTIRRRAGQKLVAVTCHYDVAEWLDPDWIYEPAIDHFQWRLERQGRPPISLEVERVGPPAWRLFRNHHYLSTNLNHSAVCFCAFLDGRPVAFSAWLPFLGRLRGQQRARRNHRTVCLPDFQGVGIGQDLVAFCASFWTGLGYRAFSASSHPGEIAAKNRSPHWCLLRAPSRAARGGDGNMRRLARTRASNRLTASFEYVGPKLDLHVARRLYESKVHRPDSKVET